MQFNGTILIMDPCSAVKSNEDWQKCLWGADMSVLGFTRFLSVTLESDRTGQVVDSDSHEIIGTYCTDSCVLTVLYFEELMKYNPQFSDHMGYPQNSVILQNFSGEISLNDENMIVGSGNIHFIAI